MDKNLYDALEKVIFAMQKDNKLYDLRKRDYSRDGNRFTVLGLRDLANEKLFDDCPTIFGITSNQATLVTTYFKNVSMERSINELYKTFPNIFLGESMKHIDKDNINVNIPLFKL